MQVAVWDCARQCWVPHVACPGEQRVRVDERAPLSNFLVYEVYREPEDPPGALRAVGELGKPPVPLTGWAVDYT